MSQQYLRSASLVVSGASQAIELSELRFTFRIKQFDLQTPNLAHIRVYNLSDDTSNKIQKEFTGLVLGAGYGGDLATIFLGTIVQVRRGRENAVDLYTDIIAADGDNLLSLATISMSMGRGKTYDDRLAALRAAANLPAGYVAPLPSGALPRGRVFYGAVRDHLRDLAFATDTRWSIQRGAYTALPLNGYPPGEAVVLTSATGMLGMPEQTEEGIRVKCLLNPRIGVGTKVHIDNGSIQQAQLNQSIAGVGSSALLPRTTADGFYRVVVAELSGDTRGADWTSDLTCIAVNDAAPKPLLDRGYL